jgi:hypothetical protein
VGIISEILTIYKADTSDLKRKVKELRGEQKAAAKAQLEEVEKQNEQLERHIKMLGKVTIALGAVTAGVMLAADAWKSYAAQTKLEVATAGVNLDRLKKATGGLRTEQELLELAQKAFNRTAPLTNQQLQNAVLTTRQLTRAGFDATEVWAGMEEAITQGSVEPLKKFGIVLPELSGKTSKQAQLMDELAKRAGQVGAGFSAAGDAATRMGVKIEDAVHKMKVKIGELVNDNVEFFATLTGLGKSDIDELNDRISAYSTKIKASAPGSVERDIYTKKRAEALAEAQAWQRANNPAFPGYAPKPASLEQWKRDLASINQSLAASIEEARILAAKAPKGGGSFEFGGFVDPNVHSPILAGVGTLGAAAGFNVGTPNPFGLLGGPNITGRSLQPKVGDIVGDTQKSYLESIFGPAEEFNVYAEGFKLLQTASETAVAAWIDGQENMAAASKHIVADLLKGVSIHLTGLATQEAFTAAALAVLLNPAAGQHAAAAGIYAAGAAATGGLARLLGTSASVQAPGGAAAGTGAGLRPAALPERTTNTTVVIGDDFAGDSPRRRAATVKRAIRAGDEYTGEGNQTVRFA